MAPCAGVCFSVRQGVEFHYEHLGKAIPPPKDRQPSGGNYKEMPEGVQPQPAEVDDPNYH